MASERAPMTAGEGRNLSFRERYTVGDGLRKGASMRGVAWIYSDAAERHDG